MRASDLTLITKIAEVFPRLLPHMIAIYQLGYKQAQIDGMKSRENDDLMLDRNYGSEMRQSN